MNILYITPFVPEEKAGHAGGVCTAKMLEILKRNNNVTVLTYANNDKEYELLKLHPDFRYIRYSKYKYLWNFLKHLNMPAIFAVRNDREFKNRIIQIIQEKSIDAIHAEFTAMGQFEWIKKKFPDIKFTLVEHDVTVQSYMRKRDESKGIWHWLYSVEAKKVQKYENQYLKNADNIIIFNEKDRRLINDIYGIDSARVINPYFGVSSIDCPDTEKEYDICFVGAMNRQENIEAANTVIEIAEKQHIRASIIGANPPEEMVQRSSEYVNVTGFVDDINSEIIKSKIAVFPLKRGAGIKLKVLLACCLGIPVITTGVGAEGIDEEGKYLIIANTDEDILRETLSLINSPEEIKELGKQCQLFVKNRFDLSKTEKVFKEIYDNN